MLATHIPVICQYSEKKSIQISKTSTHSHNSDINVHTVHSAFLFLIIYVFKNRALIYILSSQLIFLCWCIDSSVLNGCVVIDKPRVSGFAFGLLPVFTLINNVATNRTEFPIQKINICKAKHQVEL